MDILIHPVTSFQGRVGVPGDKSIAHRAAIFASIAEGVSTLSGFPCGEDTLSTLSCLRQLGVSIVVDDDRVTIEGVGRRGFLPPEKPLDCGNSGTTMRLLAGLLAGQDFESVLTGDSSLLSRPMERISRPLVEMGADVTLQDGRGPIRVRGSASLRGIDYTLPVASAQVKTCVLIAGLLAVGDTIVRESLPSRDHTERMLNLPVETDGLNRVIQSGPDTPISPANFRIPGDVSSAAFLVAAGSLVEDSQIRVDGVGLNPTRCGFLEVLEQMGAGIEITEGETISGEPVGSIEARSAHLSAGRVSGPLVPRMIDEVPILAVVASQAHGMTRINQVGELRIKETDRLAAMQANLNALGVSSSVGSDRMRIDGPQKINSGTTRSFGDHRIAMAMGVAGLIADGPVTIQDAHAANVSYPGFWDDLRRLSRPRC